MLKRQVSKIKNALLGAMLFCCVAACLRFVLMSEINTARTKAEYLKKQRKDCQCPVLDQTLQFLGKNTSSPYKNEDSSTSSPDLYTESKCTENGIVFIKTHKTGSSTVASILQRYGYTHDMKFLVPSTGSLINYVNKFSARSISPKWRKMKDRYDLLANHARYDRREISSVFPNACFITILRDPIAQFESAFYYFDIPDALPPTKKTLTNFMEDPLKHFVKVQGEDQYMKHSIYNQQLFDFGLDHADMFRPDMVEKKISEINDNFNLVMICEYFDESLILLRKLLGWSMDDMVYLRKGMRSPKFSHKKELNSSELRAKIRAWNAGDVKLYDHFNWTFWQKVVAYGPMFSADLAQLKLKLAGASNTCLNKNRRVTFIREDNFRLRVDAPAWCRDAARNDYQFTQLIRLRMTKQGISFYNFKEVVPRRKRSNAEGFDPFKLNPICLKYMDI